jgi:DNA-binding response OmpR family regulator
LKILIVDEHAASLAVLSLVLKSRGYTCESAMTAADALTCAAKFQPHVVIYEWDLHSGGGSGLATRLREVAATITNVIALSVRDEPAHFRQSERVDAYATKPVDLTALESLFADSARANAMPAA